MRSFWIAAALFAALACGTGVALRGLARPGFYGDGVGYYAPLASVVFDHDLDLRNQLMHLSPAYLRAAYMTPEGRLGDPFAVGSAFLWAPGVLLATHLPPSAWLDAPLRLRTNSAHPAFAPRFGRVVLFTDAIAVLLGGALLAGTLASVVGSAVAALAVAAIVFGTPTFFYVLVAPSYGHAASFAVVSLFVSLVLLDRRRGLPLALLGAVLGLVTLVRWQDMLLGLLLVPRLLDEWRAPRATPRRLVRAAFSFAVPGLLVFTPQMLFWARIYGRPLLVPPGPDFLPFWRPQFVPMLLSTWNGAWIWSPLLLAGWMGMLFWPDRRLRLAAFIAVALEVYVCAILLDWWGGNSFGARRLVSLAPLAAVGLAFLLQRARASRLRTIAAAALLILGCLWSVRLAAYWSAGLLPPNPGSAADYVRFYSPDSAHARRYGLWDYPRLLSEAAQAEKMLRATEHRPSE
jgi:hypothetical protein